MPSPHKETAVSEFAAVVAVACRQWWPHAYLDEGMPAGRETPDAWLCRLDDGAHAYGIKGDVGFYGPTVLREGDIVAFSYCDNLGGSALTFLADDTPQWHPPIPAECNHLWDGDDLIADTPKEFADGIQDSIASGWLDEDDAPFIARLSRWTAEEFPSRFTGEGGEPRFVPLYPPLDNPAEPVSAPDLADGDQASLDLCRPET